MITVLAALQSRGATFGADLGSYLNQMAQSAPSASGIAAQANVIVDRALLRGVIAIGDKMAGLAYKPLGKRGDQVLD